MKRVGEVVVLLCVLAFVVTLCGCGGSGGPNRPGEGPAGKPPAPRPPPLTNPALALTKGGAGLWISNSSGSTMEQVTARKYDGEPAWSPDGAKIAFRRQHDPTDWGDFYTIQPDGTGLTLLYDFPGDPPTIRPNSGPKWFPQGTKIIYDNGYDLVVMDTSTTPPSFQNLDEDILADLPSGREYPSVGPDMDPGEPGFQGLIAYEDACGESRYRIAVMEIATDEDGRLTLQEPPVVWMPPGQTYHSVPQLSSNGDRIAFVHQDSSSTQRICVVPFTAGAPDPFGTPVEVTSMVTAWPFGPPNWSPDDRWLTSNAFTGYTRAGYSIWDVFRVRPEPNSDRVWVTSPTDQVTWSGADWNPAWTPDL